MIRLNLLPENIREEIDYAKSNYKITQNFMRVISIFLVLFVFQAVLAFVLIREESNAKVVRDQAKAQNEKWSELETEAKDFSSRLTLINKLEKENINWIKVFTALSDAMPYNVMLDSIEFQADTSADIRISGRALSDADVGLFRKLLVDEGYFEFADIEKITNGSDPKGLDRDTRDFVINTRLVVSKVKND